MNACDVYCIFKNTNAFLDGNWLKINTLHSVQRMPRDVKFWNSKAYKTRMGILCDKIKQQIQTIEEAYHVFAYAWYNKLDPYKQFSLDFMNAYKTYHRFHALPLEIENIWRYVCLYAVEHDCQKELVKCSKTESSILLNYLLTHEVNPHIIYLFDKILKLKEKINFDILTHEESVKCKKYMIIIDKWHNLFYNDYNALDIISIKNQFRRIFDELQ